MAEQLPQVKIARVSKTSGIHTLGGREEIQVHVVVMNPSDEVYAQLERLVETGALITLGGVPAL